MSTWLPRARAADEPRAPPVAASGSPAVAGMYPGPSHGPVVSTRLPRSGAGMNPTANPAAADRGDRRPSVPRVRGDGRGQHAPSCKLRWRNLTLGLSWGYPRVRGWTRRWLGSTDDEVFPAPAGMNRALRPVHSPSCVWISDCRVVQSSRELRSVRVGIESWPPCCVDRVPRVRGDYSKGVLLPNQLRVCAHEP